ncbi:hypothetical protein AA103196_0085 [Ameyamaea chiangmaiensis NBRC 103196]|uniref:DUF768 domain-containing protein n=1 Tax=Ameyamaea chiangmaiensis TaxID=442969 RepID=A0A850P549_9PROT|nr:hypothetical protein [Ameyamaea chiangmaiensis]MBS4075957.1 hypothetical protein [Ameyamaea chiangmaiensis]NVN39757.1 hypothetical protein [Ameyamaea chiangmaiensis]GBQ61616.1 hypothetical protein AA103196_0085 [Ameyamaea chiangmaiensis NBRC 103196]
MTPDDIDEWLECWVEDHLAGHANAGDPTIDALVARCIADAAHAGIGEAALRSACGGDLRAFLADEHDAIIPPDGF